MTRVRFLKRIIPTLVLVGGALATNLQAAKSYRGKCLLQVNGKKYINGTCPIAMENDGGFSIGAPEKGPITYFAIISVTGKNKAEGFWNEEKGANHAHTPLGDLVRKGACWENKNAKVCAWK